jgi:HAD superfamily hydrolase (TIGR01509 family)
MDTDRPAYPVSAVIFDMDGTLTEPMLDFDAIRAEIGIARGPILEAVERMSPPERARADAILERHEAIAARDSALQPGVRETLTRLLRADIPTAIMTRNSRESVRVFLARHGLRFHLVRTREDGAIKPSPQPVHDICRALGASEARTWVVGDFHYDLICANEAGAVSVLLWNLPSARPDWAREAKHIITSMEVLPTLLRV